MSKLENHLKICKLMQDKYGKFYDKWNEIVEEAVVHDDLDEWRNIRAFYEF
jgi:hypothetical protein